MMAAYRWGILAIAVLLVVVLFNLPRVVVENDTLSDQVVQEEEIEESHDFAINAKDRDIIRSLQKKLSKSIDNKKNAIFADSLAEMYLSYNELDSSALYVDLILSLSSSREEMTRAGDLYFQLYSISLNQKKAKELASKAASCFSEVLEQQEDPDIRAKLAMTKVMTVNPMEGIMMLRGVLEEYPNNKTALFGMGIMSVQSGQYDKAVKRFEKLTVLDPSNSQAAYYLAVSYYEIGEKEKASEQFKRLKSESTDPAIIESADKYLKELNVL